MITTTVKYREAGSDVDTLISHDTGNSIRTTLDNSLNDGRFVISKTKRQEPYPRWDKVLFEFTDDITPIPNTYSKGFYIFGDLPNIEAKGSDKRWNHEMILIEPTKIHERYFVDTKAFSRNKDGSAIYTMYDVLVILQDLAYFEREDIFLGKEKVFIIPTSVQTILERIDAPQLFFKETTLREAIDGLLAFIDATYELDIDRNITLRFFNEKKGEITEIGDFDDELRIAIGDYYQTELDVIAVNVVNDKVLVPTAGQIAGVNRHTIHSFANRQNSQNRGPATPLSQDLGTFGSVGSTTGGALPGYSLHYRNHYTCDTFDYTDPTTGILFTIGDKAVWNGDQWLKAPDNFLGIVSGVGTYFRSEDVILGDTNMVIQLNENLNIYEIEDVYISVTTTDGSDDNKPQTANMTDFVKTDAQYAKLGNDTVFDDGSPNKQNTVTYDIGGNQIKGFGQSWGILGIQRTLDNLIKSLYKRGDFTDGIGLQLDEFTNDQVMFTVTYRPIVPKMRIKAARTNTEDINIYSALRENQSENIISAQNYGGQLLAKANRLGNEEWFATQTVIDLSKLYRRGYVTSDGFIVTVVEIVMYPEFLKVKYTLVKDFNRLSEFIGLAGRRRQYELKPEDAVDRFMNYTEYLQVIPGAQPFENDTIFSDFAIDRILESLIFTYGDNTVRGVIIESDEFDIDVTKLKNYTAGDTAGIYLPVFKTGTHKSLVFNFSFQDTLSAGDRLETVDDAESHIAVPYTNINGFLISARFKFVNYLNPKWLNPDGLTLDYGKYRNDAKNAPAIILENVNLDGNQVVYGNGEYRIDKDVADRLSFTQQLQFSGVKRQVGIGNEWARLCQLILDLPGPTLYFYIDTTNEQYTDLEDKKVKISASKLGPIEDYAAYDQVNKQFKLNSTGIAATLTSKSWAIGDNDGNLWLWVNQVGVNEFTNTTILSFKGLNKKTELIYNI